MGVGFHVQALGSVPFCHRSPAWERRLAALLCAVPALGERHRPWSQSPLGPAGPRPQARGPRGGHAWLSWAPGHPDVRRSPPARFTALSQNRRWGLTKSLEEPLPRGRASVHAVGGLPRGDGGCPAGLTDGLQRTIWFSLFSYTLFSPPEKI